MNPIIMVALSGGIFASLCFIHFFVDWIFQSHSEAMIKHNHPWIRAKHCLIYTVGFAPIMYLFNYSLLQWLIGLNILFWSHFYLDTYHLVYLWAKFIRCPPEMIEPWKETFTRVDGSASVRVHPPDAKRGFMEWVQTTMGKILMIAIDQISHLSFLWVLVYFAVKNIK